MAGVSGDAFDELSKLLQEVSKYAIPEAENAAAQVYLEEAKAAAPVKSGRLRSSIKIIEGKNTKTLMGDNRRRLFVGPEKKKGYYGFFLERGWISVGSRRRKRTATKTTHSQAGMEGGTPIPAKEWFEPAMRAADAKAVQAAEDAFYQKMKALDSR